MATAKAAKAKAAPLAAPDQILVEASPGVMSTTAPTRKPKAKAKARTPKSKVFPRKPKAKTKAASRKPRRT